MLLKYGLEGGESMLPALDALFHQAAKGLYAILMQYPVLTVD
jgi:2-oxoglutarate dehydrogenase complex dehydrogenase (E1) component-like enzyme